MRRSTLLEPATVESIRAIFLHREHRVTLDEAARMLGWTRARLNEAIDAEEINVVGMFPRRSARY